MSGFLSAPPRAGFFDEAGIDLSSCSQPMTLYTQMSLALLKEQLWLYGLIGHHHHPMDS
jgi:hypothetical protein